MANGSVRDVVGRWISDAFHAIEVAGEHRLVIRAEGIEGQRLTRA